MAFTFPASEQKEVMAVDMSIDTEIKNAVSAADQDAQYDDKAKRLLGNKIILAAPPWIPVRFLHPFPASFSRKESRTVCPSASRRKFPPAHDDLV